MHSPNRAGKPRLPAPYLTALLLHVESRSPEDQETEYSIYIYRKKPLPGGDILGVNSGDPAIEAEPERKEIG